MHASNTIALTRDNNSELSFDPYEGKRNKILHFLGSIPTDKDNVETLGSTIESLGGKRNLTSHYDLDSSSENIVAKRIIEEATGFGVESCVSIIELMKVPQYNRDYFVKQDPVYSSSHDSNTYSLDGGRYILKAYPWIGEQELKAYHKLQNKFSEITYKIARDGTHNGEKYSSIEVNVLYLPENGIIGTNHSSMSVVPFCRGALNRKDHFTGIKLTHENIELDLENDIGFMNYLITGIHNGVLSITVTDIGRRIKDILRESGYYEVAKEGMLAQLKKTVTDLAMNHIQ